MTTNILSGDVLDGLSDVLTELWIKRAPADGQPKHYAWSEMIESIQDTARAAAAMDGLTPPQIIDRQIEAVRAGHVDGRTAERVSEAVAPFCGCLIGWAGHAVGQSFTEGYYANHPLFRTVREHYDWAPVEILALLLLPGEQDTPQASLVIQALEQAREGL